MAKQRHPYESLVQQPIHGLELMRAEREKYDPIGYQHVSAPEQQRRLSPLIGLVAQGQIPLDEKVAGELAPILDAHARKLERL